MLIIVLLYQQFENYCCSRRSWQGEPTSGGFFVIVTDDLRRVAWSDGAIIAVPIIASIRIVVKELTADRRAAMALPWDPPDAPRLAAETI